MRDPSLDLGLASEVPLGTAEPAERTRRVPLGASWGEPRGDGRRGPPRPHSRGDGEVAERGGESVLVP